RRSEHGELDAESRHLGRRERRKARVAARRRDGHLANRLPQRALGVKRAKAAAQLAAYVQGHEGGGGPVEPFGRGPRVAGRLAARGARGGPAREGQQALTLRGTQHGAPPAYARWGRARGRRL